MIAFGSVVSVVQQVAFLKMGKGKKNADLSAPSVDWQVGQVAKAWEANNVIRARGRACQSLTKWTTPATRGIASMGALNLNPDILLELAQRWCPLLPFAKSPPIPLLRAEVNTVVRIDLRMCFQAT